MVETMDTLWCCSEDSVSGGSVCESDTGDSSAGGPGDGEVVGRDDTVTGESGEGGGGAGDEGDGSEGT